MSNQPEAVSPDFIITKEYRRFAEFCDACRRYRYIGICHGPPGVGKTLSARQYAHWELLAPLVPHYLGAASLPEGVRECRTIFYTVGVENTPKRLAADIDRLRLALSYLVEDATAAQQ